MKSMYEYECALSGLTEGGSIPFDADDLDDLPAGWTELRFSRRIFNPRWVMIQHTKKAMVEGLLLQVPEENREQSRVSVQLQVDANFYGLEADTPMYLTEVETVYLSPPEANEQVAEAYNTLRQDLGLEPVAVEDAGEETEEEGEGEKK